MEKNFRSGFIAIVGKPNAGKSTLLNRLLGQKLCIVTPKAQTTRHRILGILNEPDYQMVFNDTPGVIVPDYELHKRMMKSVSNSLHDADVILLLAAVDEKFKEETLIELLKKSKVPIVLAINKIDLADKDKIDEREDFWRSALPLAEVARISALKGDGADELLNKLLNHLPENPPYFEQDQLTDRTERFFVSEIIREKLFLLFEQEIPYSCEVLVQLFEERDDMIYIDAEIHVERQSQKGMIIGRKGAKLSEIGAAARKDIEAFLEQKVFLKLYVRVSEDWKNKDFSLRNFGYSAKS